MLPSLIPGASLLYSSKDIIQNATVDLHALSRTLHKVQSNRNSKSKNVQRENALRSKIHEKTERMEGMEKDIVRNVQIVSQSIRGGLTNEWASSLLEMEDHLKFDTNRMNRILQHLQFQIKEVDQEIAELLGSDEHFGKFRSNQQQQLLKRSSLESQLSTVNKKFSTIKSEVKQLKLDLSDLSQGNQILRHRLNSKGSFQVDMRDRISSLFFAINQNEIKEKESYTTLSSLISSSEKLEILCQQEWRHVMVLVAEKAALEENVRRFRSGDPAPTRKRANKKNLALIVSEAVETSELDRICKVWAQCTWSNAIDSIKIESAMSWLKKRQQEWRMVTSDIGMDVDVDELCQWFVDHEDRNILQFEEVRTLALQRNRLSNESAALAKAHEERDTGNGKTASSSALVLLQKIEMQTQELETFEDERKHICLLIEDVKNCLSNLLVAEEPQVDTDLSGNLSDTLVVLEQWTKEALSELYGPYVIPDCVKTDLIPLQIEPPDIGRPSGSVSDEEDSI